jgi:probable aminopeptidase NPEPL1
MVIGKKKILESLLPNLSDKLGLEEETAQAVLEAIDGSSGSASTFVKKQKVVLGTIPDKVTRNNHPWSVHSITELVAGNNLPKGLSRVIFVGDGATEYQGALAAAVAKAFPVYSRKTKSKEDGDENGYGNDKKDSDTTRSIQIAFWDDAGSVLTTKEDATRAALAAVEGVQLATRLVDTPPEELTTDVYAEECRQLADQLEGVTMTEIVGEELNQKGYGGIYGVGRAATSPPRLVIMEYTPPTSGGGDYDGKTVALVGKGVIYDTGGLSLKPKVGMCGMKFDMGGSAGKCANEDCNYLFINSIYM